MSKIGIIVTTQKEVLQFYYIDNKRARHTLGLPEDEIINDYDSDTTYNIFLDTLPNQFIVRQIQGKPQQFLKDLAEGYHDYIMDKLFEILEFYMNHQDEAQA